MEEKENRGDLSDRPGSGVQRIGAVPALVGHAGEVADGSRVKRLMTWLGRWAKGFAESPHYDPRTGMTGGPNPLFDGELWKDVREDLRHRRRKRRHGDDDANR
jgi:hypothetical protein